MNMHEEAAAEELEKRGWAMTPALWGRGPTRLSRSLVATFRKFRSCDAARGEPRNHADSVWWSRCMHAETPPPGSLEMGSRFELARHLVALCRPALDYVLAAHSSGRSTAVQLPVLTPSAGLANAGRWARRPDARPWRAWRGWHRGPVPPRPRPLASGLVGHGGPCSLGTRT